jgi:FkbM family methyltransferase
MRRIRAPLRVVKRKSQQNGGPMFEKMRKRTKAGLDSLLHSRGYRLERPPGILLDYPEAELQIDLDFIMGHCLVHHFEPGSFRDVFFVEIGAYDGSSNDPVHAYAKRFSWRGLVVEPQSEFFETLRHTYADQPGVIAVNAASESENGWRTLYRIRPGTPGLPVWAAQLASFDRNHLVKHRGRIPNIEDILFAQEVPCMTLDTLLDRYSVKRVDVLQIDTEGFDSEIIKMINFERIQPYVIVYEHKHLSHGQQVEALTVHQTRGYKISMSRSNTVAYRKSS